MTLGSNATAAARRREIDARSYVTVVDATVRLKNGKVRSYRWKTSLPVLTAYRLAPKWVRVALRTELVAGRSSWEGVEIGIRLGKLET